jgi:alpha-galactosidase
MPLLRKTMLDKHLAGRDRGRGGDELHAGGSERVRTEIMRLTGHFQTESSAHASEYLAYFRKDAQMVLDYQPSRWDYYEICSAHADPKTRVESFLADVARAGRLAPSHEYGAQIVDSVVTGTLRLVHGSVPNDGIISNLPRECSVEVPVAVDAQGLRPQVIGALPPACAAVNRLSINQVQLAVEAALTGDRDLVYAAVAMDPLTAALLTLPQIRRMVDEMIAAQRRWLPTLTSRTVVTAGAADAARRAAKAVAAKKDKPRLARAGRKA